MKLNVLFINYNTYSKNWTQITYFTQKNIIFIDSAFQKVKWKKYILGSLFFIYDLKYE